MRSFSLVVLWQLITSSALAGPRVTLIEQLEADLKKDQAFSDQEREEYLAEFRQQLGAYAFDVLKGDLQKGVEVVTTIVMEGSFDQVPVQRIVAVATGAYVAISRGAPSGAVLGIAQYGFRKNLKADTIAALANGYRECVKAKVPAHVAKDLVYYAADRGWDIETYNRLKRGLLQASREGFNPEDFNAYLLGHFLKGKTGPGRMVAQALRVFRRAAGSKSRPEIPKYQSPCTPPAPPPQKPQQQKDISKVEGKPVQKPPKPGPGESPPPKPEERKIEKKGFFSRMDGSIASFLDVPYVWGGQTRRGTDCSGFVQAVFAELGIDLPRSSRQQWQEGRSVTYNQLKKGDLVFFRTIANRISHVGIMTKPDDHEFVHASSSRGVVHSNLDSKYYKQRYAGARRVIPEWLTGVIF